MCKQQEVKLESRDIAAVRKGERMPRKEVKPFLGLFFGPWRSSSLAFPDEQCYM
jgi:hypothetical protein